jgi:hypothetical protein
MAEELHDTVVPALGIFHLRKRLLV